MENKRFKELTDKFYNEALDIYHDTSLPPFNYIEDDIYDKCTESNEYTGSIRLGGETWGEVGVMLEELGINSYDLSEEEFDKLCETVDKAECKAYRDNLDSFKEKGYDVKYEWDKEFINFTVTKS